MTVPVLPVSSERSMSMTAHLEELRGRLLTCLLLVVIGMAVNYYFIDEIISFITAPVGKLYFIKPAEAFFMYFKILFIGAVFLASPFLFYEFWAFVVPAFSSHEKKTLAILVPSSLFLFLFGASFAFLVVVPRGLAFFMTFATDSLMPMISLESYLSFALMLILPFGFLFNLPLVLLILAQMGLLTSEMLAKKRKIVYFASFIIAAIITPTTDMVSQCFLAVPMIGLYEISRMVIQYILNK